jgi:hypothetical protein
MTKRSILRLLAVALIAAVCILGVQAVGHWHDNPLDEAHCQVCHIGHSAIPQPAVQADLQMPVAVARFAPSEHLGDDLESVRSPSIPRAPPV